MSHVLKMRAQIRSLPDLRAAVKMIPGLVYEEAKEFQYWSDFSEPCLAKIRLADHTGGYGNEIGIRQEKDGTYSLNYDPSMASRINAIAGYNLIRLVGQYNVEQTKRKLGANYRYRQTVNADGSIDLEAIDLRG